jgi:IS605 OrfB family transposase
VKRLAVGDVRDISDRVDKGAVANQKISQWPHGQFVLYLTYKARREGITVEQIDESYSTRTCSQCGYLRSYAPQGRVLRCSGCGAHVHRDANGAANICSRAAYGQYSLVQIQHVKHLRATVVRASTQAPVAGSKPPQPPQALGEPPEAVCL